MSPVIKALHTCKDQIESKVVVTAQHRGMMDQVLQLFDVAPDYDLNVMTENQTPSQVSAAIFTDLERVLRTEKPDWILIQGDTTTVMVAALAAFYNRVHIGHIEAGLRTGNKWHPFPEEINRRVASLVADLHFAPTENARRNLLAEGVDSESIVVTGNPVVDALHWVRENRPPTTQIQAMLPADPGVRLILLTAHRRENFGEGLANICEAVTRICGRYRENVQFVYPVHPNPQVQHEVRQRLGGVPQVTLVEPLDYASLAHLMAHSYLVMTDSGGLQEEAPSLGKPVLVLRETTERPEVVEAGAARLVGTDPDRILQSFAQLWEDDEVYREMARQIHVFGDGTASVRIVKALRERQGEPVVAE